MVLALRDLWEKPKKPKKLLLREVGTADFIIARHAKSLPSVQDLLSLLAICDDLFFFFTAGTKHSETRHRKLKMPDMTCKMSLKWWAVILKVAFHVGYIITR